MKAMHNEKAADTSKSQFIEGGALLSRKELARALNGLGYPITSQTLATKAVRGGGPPFRKFGARAVLYRWSEAVAWAEGKLSAPVNSTSEALPLRDSTPSNS
ncbi:hypothetical protein Acid7E03_26380 [Acidisoma sp. 7E03]